MKKLVIIFISIVLVFGTVAIFTGCFDTNALEQRIAELERELDELRELDGIPGPQGPIGPQGEQGPPGTAGNGQQEERIYLIGETFTYYSPSNIPLFSITLELHPMLPSAINARLTNHNIPGFIPNGFIVARLQTATGFATLHFGNSVLAAGNSATAGGSSASGKYIWFGAPNEIHSDAMMPIVRFRIEF